MRQSLRGTRSQAEPEKEEWPAKKTTVEACRQLNVNQWARDKILRPGVCLKGVCRWYTDATRKDREAGLNFEVDTVTEPPHVRLSYTVTHTGENMSYDVELTTTRPRLGGLRWWYICPLFSDGGPCARRVGKLYLPPGEVYFGCRHCYRLTYASSQASRKHTALFRRLAADMGTDAGTARRAFRRPGKGPLTD